MTRDGHALGQRRGRGWQRAALLALTLVAVGLVPAATASASNIGGGEASGTVAADPGKGVPPLGAPCAPTAFTITGTTSEAFAFNTGLFAYAGPITFVGKTSATCEGTSSGFGLLELTSVKGSGLTPGNSINCADPATGTKLTGGFTRNGSIVNAVVGGTCIVVGTPAPVQVFFRGNFAPTNTGGGVVEPITTGVFAGPFVISPA